MLPVPRIASSFFTLWAFSTTPCVLNAAVVDSALGIVGIDHKISSSDWMRSRIYPSSFVGHSSYSNFHATASFRKIDKLSRIFYTFVSATLWAEKLNQYLSVHLLGTFLCSRSARTILTKSFFCQSLGYLQRTCLSTCPLVLYIFSSARHEKGPSSMHSKHLLYWSFPFQHLGLRLEC